MCGGGKGVGSYLIFIGEFIVVKYMNQSHDHDIFYYFLIIFIIIDSIGLDQILPIYPINQISIQSINQEKN